MGEWGVGKTELWPAAAKHGIGGGFDGCCSLSQESVNCEDNLLSCVIYVQVQFSTNTNQLPEIGALQSTMHNLIF